MRMLDGLVLGDFNPGTGNKEKTVEILRKAQLIVADNVGEYWRSVAFGRGRPPVVTDFPNVMLPFEYTFVEIRNHDRSDPNNQLESTGILLSMVPPVRYQEVNTEENDQYMLAPSVKWHMTGVTFFKYRGAVPRLMARFAMPIDGEGKVLPVPNENVENGIGYAMKFMQKLAGIPEHDLRTIHTASVSVILNPTLLTLSFMHCRNVKVRQVCPPPKLSKKRQKKTGQPLLTYRVLQIDHMKQTLEQEGHVSSEGLKKALHICRGHFASYGRDGKGLLFGKHTTTVWIPMHVRGNAEEGIVVKDYDVK